MTFELKDYDQIREKLKELLDNPNCIAIYTESPTTSRVFFRDSVSFQRPTGWNCFYRRIFWDQGRGRKSCFIRSKNKTQELATEAADFSIMDIASGLRVLHGVLGESCLIIPVFANTPTKKKRRKRRRAP